MDVTIDQALKMGIEAHQSGRVQDADGYYTAILKVQPTHPDANHNMGILGASVGQAAQALPFFEAALAANSAIEQYWVSYILTLIGLERSDAASHALARARDKGFHGEAFTDLARQISGLQQIDTDDMSVDPPEDQQQSVMDLHSQGTFEQTLDLAAQMLEQFPNSSLLWNIQGAAYAGFERFYDAIDSFNKAIHINPNFSDAYNNLAVSYKGRGDLVTAAKMYRKAINITPDYAAPHYNLGNVLREQFDFESSIESYKQAIKLNPDFSPAYNNMGSSLETTGALELAANAFKMAIKINPEFIEARFNLGNVLNKQNDIAGALTNYKYVVDKQPQHAECHNNMGLVYRQKGDTKAAIESLVRALCIESDNKIFWANIFVPLKVNRLADLPALELLDAMVGDTNSNAVALQKAILEYRLCFGGLRSQECFTEVIRSLSDTDHQSVFNPKGSIKRCHAPPVLPEKVVALLHFGRSGTGLMHSLVDGHSDVSSLPSIYFSEFFDLSMWERITAGGWDKMIDRFIAAYPVLFDAGSSAPVASSGNRSNENLGVNEGMASVGKNKDEVLTLDKGQFSQELSRLMECFNELNAFDFFQLVHCAYEKVLGNPPKKDVMFYHIHNPDTLAKLNFIKHVPKANWLVMVREPIQSCESWIRECFRDNQYDDITVRIVTVLFALDDVIYRNQNSVGLRLEDLKQHPKKTMIALCKWMGIEEEESLYEMTAQGKIWWGDSSSQDLTKDNMTPFGKASIEREAGSVLSEHDQFILATLFYPFRVRFGYVDEDLAQFKTDLQRIRPMLEQIFDFEEIIVKETQADKTQFMQSGPYRYLRTCMLDRWNVLNEFHTYPHMLEPLYVNVA